MRFCFRGPLEDVAWICGLWGATERSEQRHEAAADHPGSGQSGGDAGNAVM